MNNVDPIRNIAKISEIEDYLRQMTFGDRNYMLFKIGINNARRISDLLKMRVGDVRGRTHFSYKEQKTKKHIKLLIHPKLRKEIDIFIQDKNDFDFLFKSKKSHNQPISRQRVWQILNECKKAVNLNDAKIGTHTMRKTFGYHYYKKTHDVVTLMRLYNHSDQRVTLMYIGIIQDDLDNALKNFYI